MDEPPVSCAMCGNKLETFTVKLPFTALEDIVLVNCRRCERMIYARRESRVIEEAKWKAAS
ncbi:MAG TPA: hypothetical protein VE977_13735 [Pyrinomonadaceae bacterium]|nr:hypothetical protein [Pyrinomonadaceae bacterium]